MTVQPPAHTQNARKPSNAATAKQPLVKNGSQLHSAVEFLQRTAGNQVLAGTGKAPPDDAGSAARKALQHIVTAASRPSTAAAELYLQATPFIVPRTRASVTHGALTPGWLPQRPLPVYQSAALGGAIQREIENDCYKGSDQDQMAAGAFFNAYKDAVDKAYNFVIDVPSLGGYALLNGYTEHWCKKWQQHLNHERPQLMAAAFGYVIESLVSDANSEFAPKVSGGYYVAPQVAVGGTRPDLVLMQGGRHVAWLDLTASQSADHIFSKDSWDSRGISYAEVTYPSMDPAILAFMQQNKDNVAGAIDPGTLEARKQQAAAYYLYQKQKWAELGELFRMSAIGDEMNMSRSERGLQPERVREFILSEMKFQFGTEDIDMKLAPSILAAMNVNPAPWGFTTGFSISQKAGEAWLIDHQVAQQL